MLQPSVLSLPICRARQGTKWPYACAPTPPYYRRMNRAILALPFLLVAWLLLHVGQAFAAVALLIEG
jgi:hypothetical protein